MIEPSPYVLGRLDMALIDVGGQANVLAEIAVQAASRLTVIEVLS